MKLYRMIVSTSIALAFIFAVGYLSSLFIAPSSTWYIALEKPVFTPKGDFFEVAWIICYVIIAVCFTVSISQKKLRKSLIAWCMLGIFNVLWCFAFFKLNLSYLGLAIVLIEAIILIVITNFYIEKSNHLWIITIPLLAWYAFILAVNFSIVILN